MNWRRGIGAGLFAAFLGPIVGTVVFVSGAALIGVFSPDPNVPLSERVWVFLASPYFALMMSPFSFVLAGPAAVLAGVFVAGWVGAGKRLGYLHAAIFAALSVAIAMPAMHIVVKPATAGQDVVTRIGQVIPAVGLFAAVAVVSALVLRWMAGRLRLI